MAQDATSEATSSPDLFSCITSWRPPISLSAILARWECRNGQDTQPVVAYDADTMPEEAPVRNPPVHQMQKAVVAIVAQPGPQANELVGEHQQEDEFPSPRQTLTHHPEAGSLETAHTVTQPHPQVNQLVGETQPEQNEETKPRQSLVLPQENIGKIDIEETRMNQENASDNTELTDVEEYSDEEVARIDSPPPKMGALHIEEVEAPRDKIEIVSAGEYDPVKDGVEDGETTRNQSPLHCVMPGVDGVKEPRDQKEVVIAGLRDPFEDVEKDEEITRTQSPVHGKPVMDEVNEPRDEKDVVNADEWDPFKDGGKDEVTTRTQSPVHGKPGMGEVKKPREEKKIAIAAELDANDDGREDGENSPRQFPVQCKPDVAKVESTAVIQFLPQMNEFVGENVLEQDEDTPPRQSPVPNSKDGEMNEVKEPRYEKELTNTEHGDVNNDGREGEEITRNQSLVQHMKPVKDEVAEPRDEKDVVNADEYDPFKDGEVEEKLQEGMGKVEELGETDHLDGHDGNQQKKLYPSTWLLFESDP